MGIAFSDLTCWGYSLTEYQHMFDLTEADLRKKIVDCAAGAASFRAELSQQGGDVIAFDPLYEKSWAEIQAISSEALESMRQGLKDNEQHFVWQHFSSPDALIDAHLAAREIFLKDFQSEQAASVYRPEALPKTQFADRQFDLALCSHYFFIHPDTVCPETHEKSVKELCRIANEVRIFPLLDEAGAIAKLAGPLMLALQAENYGIEIREVPYQLRKGGNAMLRLWHNDCPV